MSEEISLYEKILNSKRRTQDSFEKHFETIKDGRCDKNGAGFNLDDRFSEIKIKVSLDSWKGWYGSSSCSSSIVADEVFEEFFLKYLNNNFTTIMRSVISMMESEANTHLNSKIKSMEEDLKLLKARKKLSESEVAKC
jgi:hypothetical protein